MARISFDAPAEKPDPDVVHAWLQCVGTQVVGKFVVGGTWKDNIPIPVDEEFFKRHAEQPWTSEAEIAEWLEKRLLMWFLSGKKLEAGAY